MTLNTSHLQKHNTITKKNIVTAHACHNIYLIQFHYLHSCSAYFYHSHVISIAIVMKNEKCYLNSLHNKRDHLNKMTAFHSSLDNTSVSHF